MFKDYFNNYIYYIYNILKGIQNESDNYVRQKKFRFNSE